MDTQTQALLDPSKFSVWNCFKKHLVFSLLFGAALILLGIIVCMIIYMSSFSVNPDGANKTLSTGMTFVFAISGVVFIVMLFGNFFNELRFTYAFIQFRRFQYEETTARLPPIERNWNTWFLSQAWDPCSIRRGTLAGIQSAGTDTGTNTGLQIMVSSIAV
jgi:hypothetical protein